jgi:zinc transport system substrate-binding protein
MAAHTARPKLLRIALLGLCLLVPALAGCAGNARYDVMASFYPLQYLTQRVAGSDYSVGSVVKPGTEPHDYEATPQDLSNIGHAKALVIQGASFEAWLETAQKEAPQTRLITATKDIDLRENPDEEERANLPSDPHTWLDPVLAQRMVRNIQDGLTQTYPDHASAFKSNADQLVADLQALDAEYRTGLAHCAVPFVITNHAAFAYMAKEYGFEQISISGLDPNSEPSPDTIKHIQDEARAHHVKVIFFEDLVDPRVVQVIADNVGAQTRVLSPVEAIVPGTATEGKDYFSVMRMDLANLREGMQCT